MTEPKINEDVKPRGMTSAYVEAPFDVAKEALESRGYRIISLKENARLRKQEGKDAYVSRNGNWTREGFVYIPEKGIFLTKNSPIIDFPVEATQCHRQGREFYLNDEQIEKALADSVQIPENVKSISTKKFGEDKITVYAFGDIAQKYGDFLKDAGIKEMPIYLCNLEKKPFARQTWFWYLALGSEFFGLWCLGSVYRLRGVSNENAEGVAQNFPGSKNLEIYTTEQINQALTKAKLSGIEQLLFEKLRQ